MNTKSSLNKERMQQQQQGPICRPQFSGSRFQQKASAIQKALRDCSSLTQGRQLHAELLDSGYSPQRDDSFAANWVVYMYGRCGSVEEARGVFGQIGQKSGYSWTMMLTAYAQNGHLEEAKGLFDAIPEKMKNLVSWNSMITAYAQAGHCREALEVLSLMDLEGIQADVISIIGVLSGCSLAGALVEGRIVHESIDSGLVSDVRVGTALLNMYGKCGQIEEARRAFDCLGEDRNQVTYAAMITVYAQNGHSAEAIQLFRFMILQGMKPSIACFVAVLDACAGSDAQNPEIVKTIHSCAAEAGFEGNLILATALLNAYSSSGNLQAAKEIFDKTHQRDVVLWTALLGGYAKNGQGKQAFWAFQNMDLEGFVLDQACFVTVLDACASAAAIEQGRIIHKSVHTDTNLMESTLRVPNSIVHMYGQCGYLQEAKAVFDQMQEHNAMSWNVLLAAYAQNGHVQGVLSALFGMTHEGILPNEVTFVSILSAFSHAGKFSDAVYYFLCMQSDYGIEIQEPHVSCIVDMLGRLGELQQAEGAAGGSISQLIAYLAACKVHGNAEALSRAAQEVLELDPDKSGPYVLLADLILQR